MQDPHAQGDASEGPKGTPDGLRSREAATGKAAAPAARGRLNGQAAPASPTEGLHPRSAELDALDPAGVVRLMAQDEIRSVEAFQRAAGALGEVARAAAASLRAGGSLVFVGAGTSGRLGALEAAECPPTFGTAPGQVRAVLAGGPRALAEAVEGAEDDATAGAEAIDAEGVGPPDLVIGIAASGRTPFVRGALAAARRVGATTALVTANPHVAAETSPVWDHLVALDTGPEVVSGSTRLKAGTATKMALNAITTAAFTALGKVAGGLMVDVRATNQKLEARARRIVVALAAVDEAEAAAALAAAGGLVKPAVLIARLGVNRAEAEARLAAASGCVRRALGDAWHSPTPGGAQP